MREPCLDCVIKHLGQAFVTNIEYSLGYPDHILLTIGHLAEASEECCSKSIEIADKIRQERLRLMDDYDYEVPYFKLYNMVNDFAMTDFDTDFESEVVKLFEDEESSESSETFDSVLNSIAGNFSERDIFGYFANQGN